jgi:hypothetical protein
MPDVRRKKSKGAILPKCRIKAPTAAHPGRFFFGVLVTEKKGLHTVLCTNGRILQGEAVDVKLHVKTDPSEK